MNQTILNAIQIENIQKALEESRSPNAKFHTSEEVDKIIEQRFSPKYSNE